jgi:SulP family sulfate permease
MVITTTSAAALAAGSAVENLSPDERPAALFLLTMMAGAVMIAAGLLRLGRFTRFVSYSVMIGFLTGVSVNIIAGQIPDLAGTDADGSIALQKAWDVVTHPGTIDVASVLTGLGAFLIIVLLGRTRIAAFSAVFALAIPTIVVILAGADVAQVEDQGEIPRGIPRPGWPDLSAFSWSLLAGAMAVAAIVLVQGVGVAESAPNNDGTRSNSNVDFIAQGVGNISSGLFRGQPVGGSVGQTSLNRAAGARTRWASVADPWSRSYRVIFCGIRPGQ